MVVFFRDIPLFGPLLLLYYEDGKCEKSVARYIMKACDHGVSEVTNDFFEDVSSAAFVIPQDMKGVPHTHGQSCSVGGEKGWGRATTDYFDKASQIKSRKRGPLPEKELDKIDAASDLELHEVVDQLEFVRGKVMNCSIQGKFW